MGEEYVILSETKDLGFGAQSKVHETESTIEILRLPPQNDIETQSREGEMI